MSDLSKFLRTQAYEHYEGIIQMGYKDSVEDLKLWKAADRIEELEEFTVYANAEYRKLQAKVEGLTKVIRMLKLEAECTSDKYLRGAILRRTVAALKEVSDD